jgi:hypothetical protein
MPFIDDFKQQTDLRRRRHALDTARRSSLKTNSATTTVLPRASVFRTQSQRTLFHEPGGMAIPPANRIAHNRSIALISNIVFMSSP